MGSDNFLYGALEGTISFQKNLFTYDIDSGTSTTFNLISSFDVRAFTWLKDREVYACYQHAGGTNKLLMLRANFDDNTRLWHKQFVCADTP